MPIGFETTSKKVFNYNFTENKINIITGQNILQETTFKEAIIKLFAKLQNTNLKVIDFTGEIKPINCVQIYQDNFDKAFAIINNEMVGEKNNTSTNLYLVVGAGKLKEKLNDKGQKIANNLFLAVDSFQKTYFILIDDLSSIKKLQVEEWYQSKVNNTNGIWLGKDIGTQMLININNLTMQDRKIAFPHLGFVINKGNHIIIKHVIDNEVNKNEK